VDPMATRGVARRRRPLAPYATTSIAASVIALIAFGYAAFPPFPTTPRELEALLGLLMMLIAAFAISIAPRLSGEWGLDVSLMTMGTVAALGAAGMSTALGQAQVAMVLQTIAVITAYFRPQRRLLEMLVVWLVLYGTAVMARPQIGAAINLLFLLIVIALAPLAIAAIAQRLRDQALHDPLTHLLNRRGLRTLAPTAFEVASRANVEVAVAIADLNGFKAFNDAHGHLEGDNVLVELASAWRQQLRKGDLLARLGGDEFALVLPDSTAESRFGLVQRLRLAHPFSFSVGFAAWDPDEDLLAALDRADTELYRAKRELER
jgi:diguanylate cyclase (GGDEF)-like protein